jgi:hypothetical protein
VRAALPPGVKQIFGRADSGSYYREAVEGYEEFNAQLAISARKASRLVEQLRTAEWKPSTDAGWECEFRYQPEGWRAEAGNSGDAALALINLAWSSAAVRVVARLQDLLERRQRSSHERSRACDGN